MPDWSFTRDELTDQYVLMVGDACCVTNVSRSATGYRSEVDFVVGDFPGEVEPGDELAFIAYWPALSGHPEHVVVECGYQTREVPWQEPEDYLKSNAGSVYLRPRHIDQ